MSDRGPRRGWDRDWYPPSRPLEVEGGLKARSARGAIAQTWWSERFIAVLEEIGVGGRLQRGRTYARKGQIRSLEIDAGTVRSVVQGSRARPYKVRIGSTAFGKADWSRLEQTLAADAWYTAQLLAGEMPPDIEEVFVEQGLSLFPGDARDLSMDCSCPDWEVPCKHLAATCYLLAERFDDDPFTMLAWRGRKRDDLLANLQAARTDRSPTADIGPGATLLEECVPTFYALQGEIPVRSSALSGPGDPAMLLDQLPPLDVTVRGHNLTDLLRPGYDELAADLVAEPPDEGRTRWP